MIKLLFGRDRLKTNQRGEILSRINDLLSCDLQRVSVRPPLTLRASRLSDSLRIHRRFGQGEQEDGAAQLLCPLSLPAGSREPRVCQLSSCRLRSPAKQRALRAVPGFGALAARDQWRGDF